MESKQENFQIARNFFYLKLEKIGYKGVIGVTEFKKVYYELMPIQRNKIQRMCKGELQNFIDKGSIICMGIAFPESAIDKIDAKFEDGTPNKNDWNTYATEYHKINKILNHISNNISEMYSNFNS